MDAAGKACFIDKETNVRTAYRMAVAAILGLGVAAAAFAHPGETGGGMGPGIMGGMGHGAMGPGSMGGQQLMTPEERTALMDKMRDAKTPEERQKIAQANRAEMEKRAKETAVTLPGPHGHGMGFSQGPHLEKN
jgi:Spy/CpxP family protein refolding chaperone